MKSSTSDPAVSLPARAALPTIGGKYFALAVLFSMNLLNYVDRYSFFAVNVPIQEDLHISNTNFGWLGSSFLIVYACISPLMGWLGDRYNRKVLLASGVGLWSLATVGTAFSTDFYHMFFWRALLGVGEASYGVIAPPLLADLFPARQRGRAMGCYYLALPVGTALGYFIGGVVGARWGWRHVFFVVGLPGVLAAFAGLVMRDPGRGASEGGSAKQAERPRLADYLEILQTPTFVFNMAGMAAVTFATGAYAAWGSAFYQKVRGMSLEKANSSIGVLLASAGLIGIAAGTFLADALLKLTKRAYLVMATVAVLGAVPLGICGILVPERVASLSFLFVASVLMSMVLGPCNTVTANVVPANRRAAGFALFIFLIHLLGDIASPPLLGWISEFFGKPAVAHSPVGEFLASIGARPVGEINLTVAMLAVAPVMALGCVFFLLGSRTLPADQDKVRKAADAGADEIAVFHH
jgi:MFS family permease